MTDTSPAGQSSDHFWHRVRTAMVALRPVRERGPAYGEAEIARSNPGRDGAGEAVEASLLAAWQQSAERKVPLSLMVVEIDRISEFFTAYGPEATEQCMASVMGAVGKVLPRAEDNCLRIGRALFAVVMPDCSEGNARKAAQAVALAIRGQAIAHKESHAGIVTASVGLAVAEPEGAYPQDFMGLAEAALRRAQRRGMGRIEAFVLRAARREAA